jgi:hypothetical protein
MLVKFICICKQVGSYLLLSWLPEELTGSLSNRGLAQAARLGRLADPTGSLFWQARYSQDR